MCGIAGLLSLDSVPPVIDAMLGAQVHRGPDAAGSWADQTCALGHRRLSIIDLSDAARQPLSNEDGTIWITFNGEIYNFLDLRCVLEELGHRFRTRTDTEVVIHAYEQWGPTCVTRLRGMFAFGLWDQPRRRLVLARDRLGKKPLHYAQVGSRLLFASELQALLASGLVPREVDLPAIDAYLSWGYVPAPHTAFRGVRKLPPAHLMTVDVQGDRFVVRDERYWSLARLPKRDLTEEAAVEALREKLAEAVRIRLMSDVPLGAFLSGGIDSSVVVGLMARASSGAVKTFTIGSADPRFDERASARRVAEKWGTAHQEFVVEPDALAVLPTLVRHFGEPFADSSAVPTYYVAKLTRSAVTVALTGDGGDESFAGYERYRAGLLADRLDRIPGVRQAAALAARMLPGGAARTRRYRARRFLAGMARPPVSRYAGWVSGSAGHFSDAEKQAMYTPAMREALDLTAASAWMSALFADANDLDAVDRLMAVDVASYLPYDLLVKADISSMAHSLESRSPFLDHEVMELAARLPTSMKLRGGAGKHLLKRAFGDLIPAGNLELPKRGFGVPVGEWLRGPLLPLLGDALLSANSIGRGYFEPAALQKRVRQHAEGEQDHGYTLWSLLMLELWHREFID
jgi:asparagine synthase (glutamine-hydrolysing)